MTSTWRSLIGGEGQTVAAKNERSALGELLVEMGLVDREQLNAALLQQRTSGGRLARILAERRAVDEDRMAKALAGRLGLESVALATLKIHEKVLALIPGPLAVKHGALPIAIKRTSQAEFIYVVMADPLDAEALSEISRASGRDIRVLVAPATELDRAIELHYKTGRSAPDLARDRAASLPPSPPPVASQPQGAPPPLPARAEAKRSPAPPMPSGQPAFGSQTGRMRAGGGPSGQATSSAVGEAPRHPDTALDLQKRIDTTEKGAARKAIPTSTPAPISTQAPLTGQVVATGKSGARALPPAPPPRPATNPSPRGEQKSDVRTSQSLNIDKLPGREGDDARRPRAAGGAPLSAPATPRPQLPSTPAPSITPAVPLSAPLVRGASAKSVEPSPPPKAFESSETNGGDDAPIPLPEDALRLDMSMGEWESDWPPEHVPSGDDSQLARGALGQPVAPPVLGAGRNEAMALEPVTTEARVEEGVYVGEPTHAGILEAALEDGSVDLLHDGPEDIATSQVELSEAEATEFLRRKAQEKRQQQRSGSKRPELHDGRAVAGTLEIPVDISDAPSPFAEMAQHDVPVGLERTGIIPAVDWENDEFVPPPLVRPAIEPLLAGTEDIPTSAAHVEIRAVERNGASLRRDESGADDPGHRSEPRFDTLLEARNAAVDGEPPKRRRTESLPIEIPEDTPGPFEAPELSAKTPDPGPRPAPTGALAAAEDSDASEMPVIEPSSLVSLIDEDGFAKPEDTGEENLKGKAKEPVQPTARILDEHDRELPPPRGAARLETSEESTNPRIAKGSLGHGARSTGEISAPQLADPALDDRKPGRGSPALVREVLPESVGWRDDALDGAADDGLDAPAMRTPPGTMLESSDLRPIDTDDEAQRMVGALLAGDSLNSAERAQVVIALGRLLLQKGLLSQDELAQELRR